MGNDMMGVYLLIAIFTIGYISILFENYLHINKSAIALLTAAASWTSIVFFYPDSIGLKDALSHHLSETSEIVFFLLGAMTIVELIDAHDGFEYIIEKIKTTNKIKFIWTIAFVTFFLSAILDNLTTAIVMMSILNKLMEDKKQKWMLLGLVVIASNAGGAWSPIGDVTTTMLWIGGQITALNIMKETFFASFICMAIPTLIVQFQIKDSIQLRAVIEKSNDFTTNAFERNLVLVMGILGLLFVPVFKTITHLPPYMGMLLSLALIWILTEIMHAKKDQSEKGVLSVNHALRKIDTPSILFFWGILMSIAALSFAGVLTHFANWLTTVSGNNPSIIALAMGASSSVLDNVPLVAALQKMYSLHQFPTDHYFWELLAYSTGTGGACFIIGSAAGVAIMGVAQIDFFWYLRKISWIALIGFLSGAAVFILQNA
jgi:Na+/H+ antiporter NhaD/arsenite permease-like protein